jgi:hypothetical protein
MCRFCKNKGKTDELAPDVKFPHCRDRASRFLEDGGFVMIGKNITDPNQKFPFEAWAYKGCTGDFQKAETVTFGLGRNACGSLYALNRLLAGKIEDADCDTFCKTAFCIRHCRGYTWKCPTYGHVLCWSYRQLADAGSPYCPRCENQIQMIMCDTPLSDTKFFASYQIEELIQAGQNVVTNWTTGHLAESVRELDRVLKELKINET